VFFPAKRDASSLSERAGSFFGNYGRNFDKNTYLFSANGCFINQPGGTQQERRQQVQWPKSFVGFRSADGDA
jgi:hypothetical protein